MKIDPCKETHMKRNSISTWLIAALASVTVGACGGDDKNDPSKLPAGQAMVAIKVVGRSTAGATRATAARLPKDTRAATLADGSTLDVTYAHVGVSKLKFKSVEQMGIETEIGIEGSFDVDLLAGTTVPDLSAVTIPAGLYRKMKVKVDDELPGKQSVVIRGTWTPASGGAAVPFELTSDEEFEFEVENRAGFELQERALSDVLVLFDLDAWFRSADFATATVGADGTIHIDDENNQRLGDALEEAIDDAAEIGEDQDHDGDAELDDDNDGMDDDERAGDSDGQDGDDDRGEGDDDDDSSGPGGG